MDIPAGEENEYQVFAMFIKEGKREGFKFFERKFQIEQKNKIR